MSGGGPGHGTGYEDAIARRMGGFVELAALVALAVLGGAAYLLLVTPGR